MPFSDVTWGHYTMDEESGTRADNSGGGHDLADKHDTAPLIEQMVFGTGVLNNAAKASAVASTWFSELLGSGWNFNGTDGFVMSFYVFLHVEDPLDGSPYSRVTVYLEDSSAAADVFIWLRADWTFGDTKASVLIDVADHDFTHETSGTVLEALTLEEWHFLELRYDRVAGVTTVTADSVTIFSDSTVLDIPALTGTARVFVDMHGRKGTTGTATYAMIDELTIAERIEVDVATTFNTLIYVKDLMEGRHGFFYDTYTPLIRIHYGEEGSQQHLILCGGDDGKVYSMVGDSDAGDPVVCQVTTASRDQGDTRLNKLYGDIMLDCDTGAVNVTATPKFNNDSVAAAAVTVNNAVRTQVPISVGTEWVTARNVSLDLQWSMNGTRSYFYIWEPRYTEEGGKVFAYDWETCFITHEMPGYFYHGYLYIVHISTANLTFTITDEDETVKASITVASSGGQHHKDFIRLPVVKGKMFKYRISSTAQFRIEGQESELLVKPWGQGGPWQRQRIFQDVPHGEAQ